MKINLSFLGWFSRLLLGFGLLSAIPLSLFPLQPLSAVTPEPAPAAQPAVSNPIPTLAYYYIWFDKTSWNRAKIDYPLEGRYSSDDQTVMRQHIRWAKAAGIQGFIVSWKSTEALNRRLDQLIDIAEEENFKLAIIYQGLDFERDPLEIERIATDLDFFIQRYAQRPAFDLFAKPMVIWSGTWMFSPQEIGSVATPNLRDKLLLLASERNLGGYQRLADLVDGNAYYWSSVNPDTFPNYEDKLADMGQAVHKHSGLWIAPAAPGFDARMIGGTTTVERKDGQTLRTQINTALASSPDALGIISWNEFSENSHIEPSQKYGSRYLEVLSEINHLPAPVIGDFDSSEPSQTFPEVMPAARLVALGGLVVCDFGRPDYDCPKESLIGSHIFIDSSIKRGFKGFYELFLIYRLTLFILLAGLLHTVIIHCAATYDCAGPVRELPNKRAEFKSLHSHGLFYCPGKRQLADREFPGYSHCGRYKFESGRAAGGFLSQ